MLSKSKPNEIHITRVYDAPVEAVWDAWTDVEQVAKWWGPRGFTITTHSKDLRVGGHWNYTMHGPDGTDYPNTTIYHEVVEHSRLVYDHGGHEDRPPLFRVTVQFTDIGGKTKMDMSMALESPDAAREIEKFIRAASGYSTWDRLAEYLEKESSSEEIFVINRSFDAPIETVFEMWTNPDHFEQWLPPVGMTMKHLRAEIKPGGASFYSMTDGSQTTFYGLLNYLEVRRPNRLVYTQQFCDANGKVGRFVLDPNWPLSMLTTVTLTQESPEQTRVTVKWEIEGDATAKEIEAFVNERAGMTKGWGGSFDKLEELLQATAATT